MTFPFVFFASALLAFFASTLCVLVIRRIPAVVALVYLFTAALTAAVTTINWQGGFSPGQLVFDFTIITGQAMLGAIVGALPASLWLKSRARRG